jgi:hypothetical protein
MQEGEGREYELSHSDGVTKKQLTRKYGSLVLAR